MCSNQRDIRYETKFIDIYDNIRPIYDAQLIDVVWSRQCDCVW